MKILLYAIFSILIGGSLIAAESADEVAQIINKNQNDPAQLCKKYGVFRGGSGEKCADKPFGDIAFVICHRHTGDFVNSQCGKKITQNGNRTSDQIYSSFIGLLAKMNNANQRTVCNTLRQSNPTAADQITACKGK